MDIDYGGHSMNREVEFMVKSNERNIFVNHKAIDGVTRMWITDMKTMEYPESLIESSLLTMLIDEADVEQGEIDIGGWRADVLVNDSIAIESKKKGRERQMVGMTQAIAYSKLGYESWLCTYNLYQRYIEVLDKCGVGVIDLHPENDLVVTQPQNSELVELIQDQYKGRYNAKV